MSSQGSGAGEPIQEASGMDPRVKRIAVAGVAIVSAVVVVLLAVLLFQSATGRQPAPTGGSENPPNATAGYGILLAGAQPTNGVPHVVIFGEYQCPACAAVDSMFGPIVSELVADGRMTAEVRTAHFKDGGAPDGPSKQAALAAAAADAVGHFDAYHAALFAGQETGFPTEFLRDQLPAAIGMTGDDLARFKQLFDARAFDAFTEGGDASLELAGVTGTPTYLVNGQQLDLQTAGTTPDEFLAAVTALG